MAAAAAFVYGGVKLGKKYDMFDKSANIASDMKDGVENVGSGMKNAGQKVTKPLSKGLGAIADIF